MMWAALYQQRPAPEEETTSRLIGSSHMKSSAAEKL